MSTITPNLTAGMSRSTAISRMREMARAKVGSTAANALTTLGALRDVLNNGAPSEYSIYNYEPGSSARAKVNMYHNSVSRISMFNYIFDQSIGLFIDPSDLSTLFQDAVGSIPVTAPGQPVGLALDKSRGLVPGPELVTNGTFTTDTNWTKGTGWTISAGAARFSAGSDNVDLVQSIGLPTVGRAYRIQLSYTYTSGGALRVIYGNVGHTLPTVSGVYTFVLIATAVTEANLRVRALVGASVFSIDNISVKELPGNHASQATNTDFRPLYATLPANGVRNLATGSADVGNATYWYASGSSNGITTTRLASGIDTDGLPYVDYRFAGTFTGASQTSLVYVASAANTYAVAGRTLTASFIARVIGGSTTNLLGIRAQVAGRDGTTAFLEGTNSAPYAGNVDAVLSISHTMTNPSTVMSNCPILIQGTAIGVAIDVSVRIKGLQFEIGSARTAYQFNYSTVNIAEPPYIQVGALKFDGSNDFLVTPSIDFSRYTTDGSPVRNLMIGASQPNTDVGWITTQSQNGITLTKIGSGTDIDGLPYVDYSVVGTATAQVYLVPNSYSTYPASLGQTYTNSAFLKILSGTPALNTVPIIEVAELTSADAYITGSGSTAIAPTTDTLITTTRTLNQATMTKVRMYVVIPPPGGSTVNYTFRLKGLQSELGSTRTAYQRTEFTNKMTVIAGVRKLSDAAVGTVAELSSTVGTNNGSFALQATSGTGTPAYGYLSRGTTLVSASTTGFSAPTTNVLTGTSDISGDSATLRVNGTQVAQTTADQGAGNFLNYLLYIGMRNGASAPFNGYLYHLVLVGKTLTSDQIYAIENYVNSKTGAY